MEELDKALKEICGMCSIAFGTESCRDAVCSKRILAQALSEKKERLDPKPLPLEELLKMNGLPIWYEHFPNHDIDGWRIFDPNYFEDEMESYNVTWTAYRYKPKETKIVKFHMYVYKSGGKYYTDEIIEIDILKYKFWEISEKIRSGEIFTGYDDMYKIFIIVEDDTIPPEYAVSFMVPPTK